MAAHLRRLRAGGARRTGEGAAAVDHQRLAGEVGVEPTGGGSVRRCSGVAALVSARGAIPPAPRVAAPQRTRDNGPMTKSELIHRVAQKQSRIVDRDVEFAVKMMLDQMAACLAGGGRIEIRGFRRLLAPFPPRASRPQPQNLYAGVASGQARRLFQARQEAARTRQSRVSWGAANGGAKVDHGSGGTVPLRRSKTLPIWEPFPVTGRGGFISWSCIARSVWRAGTG